MNKRARLTATSILVVLPIVSGVDAQAEQGGFWPDAGSNDVDAYPKPVPVEVVERAADIPRIKNTSPATGSSAMAAVESNEAVRVRILGSVEQAELFGAVASSGSTFLILNTEWENIHPKQKVSRDQLEGKADRTMGVGGLSSGGSQSGPEDFVEKDVAYKVPRLSDHVYALVDGQAIPLDPAMETLPGGASPDASFGIGRQGEVKAIQLAFQVPEGANHIALQLFDYNNGHILLGLRGDASLAKASGSSNKSVLDSVSNDVVELAALGLDFADNYNGQEAGAGWQFAVVRLGGQSVSGHDGGMGKILQFDPTKYVWVNADGGFIYYAGDGSTDAKGNIRFTPEIYQQQEVAFRVPDSAENLSMGLRINRDVERLALTDVAPSSMPDAKKRHQDGDVMEVLFFGTRRDGEFLVIDLGIKPLAKGKGLEVRTAQQFLLQTADGELRIDKKATAALPGHPPDPFVVPPGVSVRFELAYRTAAIPTALRLRGFRGEGTFEL